MSAVENKRKIEAEKALLVEKQNSERKRQEVLRLQKEREAEDAKLESERSIALRTQRDKMAKEAATKAAEVRKLKMAKQGVFGQINVIESKKKALLEIRGSVEARCQELFERLEKDRVAEEERIRSKSYSTVELGTDGEPTEAAKKRRERQIEKSRQDLTNKFFVDCDAVKASAQAQDSALLAEIRTDQKTLAATRTVSSMGDELKVSFETYDGSQNGWWAYLSLYSEGALLYADTFIVRYDAISGKKSPDLKTELNDAVIAEYSNNVDMYNSLFTRGDPIVYFEIDYTVNAESDEKPSAYNFSFNRIRVINTVNGKIMQTNALSKIFAWTMKPEQDLRFFAGIEEKEKARFDPKKYLVEKYMAGGMCRSDAEEKYAVYKELATYLANLMVKIPGKRIEMMSTEVTQRLYQRVMGTNPSKNVGANNPVENVSWYNAVCFCNMLNEELGYDLTNGFRLPTDEEWKFAEKGGQSFKYSGSNNFDAVGWYDYNSGSETHPVAQKKPNGYGLYDMRGNVSEWLGDVDGNYRYILGEGYDWSVLSLDSCRKDASWRTDDIGFRIVRNLE